MVGLTPWFAPVEWASGLPCPLSCGHLPAERMPPGMAAWQAGGSLHKRAPTPALVFRPCVCLRSGRPQKAMACPTVQLFTGHTLKMTDTRRAGHARPLRKHALSIFRAALAAAGPAAAVMRRSERLDSTRFKNIYVVGAGKAAASMARAA